MWPTSTETLWKVTQMQHSRWEVLLNMSRIAPVQLFAWFSFSSFLVIHGALVNELDDSTTSSLPRSLAQSQWDFSLRGLLKVAEICLVRFYNPLADFFKSSRLGIIQLCNKPSLKSVTGPGLFLPHPTRLLQATCFLWRRRLVSRALTSYGERFRFCKLCQQMEEYVWPC